MSGDLAAFVSARLDEDEAAAKAARRELWAEATRDDLVLRYAWGDRVHESVTAHIARHDPARVLRDVAAKRAILGMAASPAQRDVERDYVLAHLAAAWSDHPSYPG